MILNHAIIFLCCYPSCLSFTPRKREVSQFPPIPDFSKWGLSSISSTGSTDTSSSTNHGGCDTTLIKAPPRTGFAQKLLDFALTTPLWKYVLVPQARSTMAKTAEANGIPWKACKDWLQSEAHRRIIPESEYTVPSYYRQAFHAYDSGNLSWEAALEVEIVSCSVGARNFPQYGALGEEAFRGAFESALQTGGAHVPRRGAILDLGCGTGMSTRRLAQQYPDAKVIHGMDLSPYFVEIGQQLLQLQPKSYLKGGRWVSTISPDARIHYMVGDAANTKLEANAYDVVNIQFVLHEVPANVAIEIVDEAYRILKPNGQLWIGEMDFEAPAYAAQRANALLFSLIRSTEPYLDDYAESISSLFSYISTKFATTTVVPATGRHYALVAKKGSHHDTPTLTSFGILTDLRFHPDGSYRVEDTHLKVWESRQS